MMGSVKDSGHEDWQVRNVLKVKVYGKDGVIFCAFEESRYPSIYRRKCTPAFIHDQKVRDGYFAAKVQGSAPQLQERMRLVYGGRNKNGFPLPFWDWRFSPP